MTGILQFRRSNTVGILATTPQDGEFLFDTSTGGLRIGDGATAGGILLTGSRVRSVTGTTDTILAADAGKLVRYSNAGAIAVTLPQANSSAGAFFPNQTSFMVLNLGAGAVTITPTTSTINGAATLVLAQYEGARIVSDGTNYFAIVGRTAAATLASLSDVTITSPAEDDVLVYDAGTSKWLNQRPRYAIGSNVSGVLTASQNLLLHRMPIAVTFPANFGAYLNWTSQAGGTANATGSTVINVDKAASASPNTFSNVGTITIGAGGVSPTFATSGGSAQDFAAGDVLRIQGPASADATFAGFYATLVGFET